jgi:hypothetical protein
MFIAIRTERDQDVLYFSQHGGIYIEENWDSVVQIPIPILGTPDARSIAKQLPYFEQRDAIATFCVGLYKFFVDLGFTYLEINPFVRVGDQIIPLDFVGQLDDTAAFVAGRKWADPETGQTIPFPPAFGMRRTPEEAYIHSLDEKGGSSLKLTILNADGRVWPMVAGGGASVIYADTVTDLGYAKELACYGEYSGNPTTDETREYARTMFDLMTRKPDPQGHPKFLLIGAASPTSPTSPRLSRHRGCATRVQGQDAPEQRPDFRPPGRPQLPGRVDPDAPPGRGIGRPHQSVRPGDAHDAHRRAGAGRQEPPGAETGSHPGASGALVQPAPLHRHPTVCHQNAPSWQEGPR